MIGRVVSIKNKNTATVLVTTSKTHALYKKSFVSTKRFLVDDQTGVELGQIVEFVPCRPVSKKKAWRITKVVGRNIEALVSEQLKEQAAAIIENVMPAEKEKESVIPSPSATAQDEGSQDLEKTEPTDSSQARNDKKSKPAKKAKKEKK